MTAANKDFFEALSMLEHERVTLPMRFSRILMRMESTAKK